MGGGRYHVLFAVVLVSLPSRLELGLGRSMVWWYSPGDSPGLKMGPRRIRCSMRWGWCSLKGSFPDTMAWRMIPLGTQLPQGVVPPRPTHGSCWGDLRYSQAPQISLLTIVLLAHEDLWGRVGHRATESAQQRILKPHPVGKAKICT